MATTKQKEVKFKSKVVDVIDVPVYESLAELQAGLGDDSEAKIVALCNRQISTDMTNQARALHAPAKASKKKMRDAAWNVLTKEEIESVIGDAKKLEELLDSEEVLERVKAKMEAA